MELLLVEDDKTLGTAIDRGLRESGHEPTWARNGTNGLELAKGHRFDAVILDIMLPDLDGLQVLQTLRREGIQTPVLLLTALGSVGDRVSGLERGADDYLVKPFAFPELLARLSAICRRSAVRPAPSLTVGPLHLDLSTRKVMRAGREIDLSPTEFSMLEFLMRYAGLVVTRKMLSEHLWGEDWGGVTNVIDVHINHLRRKIDRGFDQPLIHTIRGRGYAIRTA
jgi:two-component system OmpR family response regulator/two-component system copper resistance phosphate regulon response regulator CusR